MMYFNTIVPGTQPTACGLGLVGRQAGCVVLGLAECHLLSVAPPAKAPLWPICEMGWPMGRRNVA